MQTISLDEAKMRLNDLLDAASKGEEVFIVGIDDHKFQIVPQPKKRDRQPGSAKGLIGMMPGFDEPIEDFKEYME